MTTKKQIATNRRNAKQSTGPRTEEGKASSSQNALKHGLSADRVVIWDEDPNEFDALRSSLFRHYQPADPVSQFQVEQLAASIWRLRRVPVIEAGIYSHFMQGPKDLWRLLDDDDEKEYQETDDDEDDSGAERVRTRKVSAETKGAIFVKAERPLTSLYRLAGTIEGTIRRTGRELESRKAERPEPANDSPIIDVEPEQEEANQRRRRWPQGTLAAMRALESKPE
jgi:hypothetical protein